MAAAGKAVRLARLKSSNANRWAGAAAPLAAFEPWPSQAYGDACAPPRWLNGTDFKVSGQWSAFFYLFLCDAAGGGRLGTRLELSPCPVRLDGCVMS